MKNKTTTSLLALFLGVFGIHRFYLNQIFYGILYLLLSWTCISVFIGIIDALVFVFMSEEKFHNKYNNEIERKCSGCGLELTGMNTPKLGAGKLNDYGRVCSTCLKEIIEVNPDFGIRSRKKYNTKDVKGFLNHNNSKIRSYIEKKEVIDIPQETNISISEQKEKKHLKDKNIFASETTFDPTENKEENIYKKNISNPIIHHQEKTYKESIIEVSEKSFNVTIEKDQDNSDIPYWSHMYVYSYDDLNHANKGQKEFYFAFRDRFLKGEEVTIEGNTNYAFILYFDLLNEYEKHQDIELLEQQFKRLGACSPKTKSYALDSLRNLLRDKEGAKSLAKANELEDYRNQYEYGFSDYDPDAYKLGRLYKEKLDLNKQQVSWLNKFYNPSNVFLSIEGCCVASIRQYLTVLEHLSKELKQRKTTIEKIVDNIKIEIKKVYKDDYFYEGGLNEEKYFSSKIESDIYLTIFKRVENSLREAFNHKRKISNDLPYPKKSAEFKNSLGQTINEIIDHFKEKIPFPDILTQIELNAQNVNRWKVFFDQLKFKLISDNQKEFITGIAELEKVNQKNPNIEHIFYEASKTIAKQNQTIALQYYAKYIYYDLKSKKIDNKPLNKTLQKLLFKTDEQLSDFRDIISKLILDKDIQVAIEEITKIYEPKRKKIVLDTQAIKKVEQKHSGTVELLNQYLTSEESISNTKASVENDGEIEATSTKEQIAKKDTSSPFTETLSLSKIQKEVLFKISKNEFSITMDQIEALAMAQGMFKNQLIDSINDSCAELLDGEVLIEEEDDSYVIEESYYNELLK